jgi:uncharacterized membrane protein
MRSGAIAVSFIATMLLAACGNKSPAPNNAGPIIPPNATGAAPLPSTTPTASPKELEAESSLAVKRGVITLTAQTRGIRLCGSNVDLTLTDQLDGALDRAYADLGGKPIYAEVYGERGDAQPSNQSAGKASSSFNVEELLYATANNPTGACAAPVGAFELLARGSGPTWSVEVHQDSMLFKQTSAPTEIKFTSVDTADTEGTVTYRAGVDRHVLELVITQRACRDASTNEYYAYSATARLDKQTLNGCARVGE